MSFITSKSAKLFAGVVGFAIALAIVGGVSFSKASAYSSDLTIGSSGADVTTLQNWLISKGFSLPAGATGYFGSQTQAALAAFQSANGISPAVGYFGPVTMAKVNAMGSTGAMTYPAGCMSATGFSTTTGMSCAGSVVTYPAGCMSTAGFSSTTGMSCAGSVVTYPAGCMSTAGFSSTTGMSCAGGSTPTPGGPLMGEAGSVESYELMSFSSEEVGEDEENVEVAGLEIEVDAGSDIDITAVRLNFGQGTADNDDFADYVTTVTIMMDGKEVGSAEAEDFDEDNDYEKTISLDGAIIKAGETGELTVALTGVNNIDSNDDGETWTADFDQVRWEDAEGTVISEDPTTGTESFTVELFASATDVELKASLTDSEDDINNSHVVDVDNSDDTDGIEVLAFDMEVEGDSDVDVDSFEVDFTSVEATGNDPADIVTEACLWLDGDELDCQNFTDEDGDSADTLVFDELDLALEAGDTYSFVVSVDAISTGGALDNGDTVTATLDVSETDADDESGEEIAGGDLTGSAVGEAVAFFDAGIMVELVSTDADANPSGLAGVNDFGTFKIVFDVTAFDTDAFIDASPITNETGIIAAGAAGYQNVDASTTSVASGVIDCPTCDDTGNTTLEVLDGTTKRFTVTVSGDGDDVFASASLTSLMYALTAIDGALLYTFNMDEFETDDVFLSGND